MATTFLPAALRTPATFRVVWLLPHPVLTAVTAMTGLELASMVLFTPSMVKSAPAALQRLASKPVTFVSVEMSNGQLLDDIRLAISCQRPVELVNRLGGNLITLDQVMDKINHIAGK